MKLTGKPSQKRKGIYLLLSVIPFMFILACTASPPPKPEIQKKMETPLRPQKSITKLPPVALEPLAKMKPSAATEEKMPYEGKIFSLSARGAPLQDVVMGLAKEAELNLVLEKGVDPMEPVSVEVNNLSLRKTLDLIFAAYDYFYTIEGNTLWVKATETRFFKYDLPPFHSTGESSGGGNAVGGDAGGYEVTTTTDEDKMDAWKQIEDALQAASAGGGDGGLLSEAGNARVDALTGTIVVTDRRENLDLVEEFLRRMELAAKRQVVLEARIMEVTLNDAHEFGINWNMDYDGFTVNSVMATANSAINLGWVAQGITADIMVNMLATQGEVNVLSSPRIHVLNNQAAVINVGETVPYLIWNRECDDNGNNCMWVPTVEKEQAGISMGVTPQISEDGMVTLHIVPVINGLVGWETTILQGGPTYRVPIIDTRGTDSIIRVADGATIVIGGLIQESHTEDVRGIPFLKDIPVLGAVFGNQVRDVSKSELVITLTPTIVYQ